MTNDITQQGVLFNELLDRPVHVRFDQPDSSSDGGALLLKAVDRKLDLTQRLANCLFDKRDPNFIVHSYRDLLRQRVFGICCGYEDCNDAARLRADPVQRCLLDRDPCDGNDLASQPTLLASKMPSVSARLIRWPTHWPMSWSNVIESDWARRSKR